LKKKSVIKIETQVRKNLKLREKSLHLKIFFAKGHAS